MIGFNYCLDVSGIHSDPYAEEHLNLARTTAFRSANADKMVNLLGVLGSLRFAADKTRPDLLYALSLLGTHALSVTDEILDIVLHVLSYANHTSDIGKVVGSTDQNTELFSFCDASYISAGDSLSQLGSCHFINRDSACVLATSKKDTTVSHSSCESEIKAMDKTIREIVTIRAILKELHQLDEDKPTTLYTDSLSTKELINTLKINHSVKHINLRINYIRECVNARIVRIVFVPDFYNVADLLTKPCTGTKFDYCAGRMLYGFHMQEIIPTAAEERANYTVIEVIHSEEDDTRANT